MKYLLLLFPVIAIAGGGHQHSLDLTVTPVFTETFNTTEVTNTVYQYDDCQGVAIGQSASSAQLYYGTSKPQVAAGMGECNGDWSGSIRAGIKIRNNLMINGGWSMDERVDAFSFGALLIFP